MPFRKKKIGKVRMRNPMAKLLRHFNVKVVRSRKTYDRKLDKLQVTKQYKDDA